MSSKSKSALLVLSSVGIVAALVAATLLSLHFWPQALLQLSGVDLGSLSGAEILSAINDTRVTLLTAIGGASVAFVAIGALWQANAARESFDRQKAVDWASAFSDATEQLADESATIRLAGTIALTSIMNSGPSNSSSLVRAALASFIRERRSNDFKDGATRLALVTVCNSKERSPQSLAEASFNGFDLRGLNFDGIDLTGVSLRSATLGEDQRGFVLNAQRVDAKDVRWKAY